jgi:hypothetical protein
MRRRQVIVGLAALAVAVAVVALWPRGPRPCRATFEQVRQGMTFEEVCAAVGSQPGDYTGGRSLGYTLSFVGSANMPDDEAHFVWATEDAFLSVWFYRGRVKSAYISDPHLRPLPPSWPDRVWKRLGL